MGANATLGEQRGVLRLNRNNLHVRVLLLQVLTGTGDGAAGANTRHENVDLTVGCFPNLGAGGVVVNGGVRLVGELGRQDSVLGGRNDFLSLLHSAAHTLGTGGQHNLSTVSAQQHATLSRHGLRHGQDDAVTASSTHHSQRNTGVTGSALNNGAAGLQRTRLLSSVNDGATDTVLNRTSGVVELKLDRYVTGKTFVQSVQLNQGGLAGCFNNAVENLCHGVLLHELRGGQPRRGLRNE